MLSLQLPLEAAYQGQGLIHSYHTLTHASGLGVEAAPGQQGEDLGRDSFDPSGPGEAAVLGQQEEDLGLDSCDPSFLLAWKRQRPF